MVHNLSTRRARACAAALVVSTLLLGAPASAADGTPGRLTSGDTLLPNQGNGGYDARSYALDLTYQRAHHGLSGHSVMTAVAHQDLSSFGLDLEGMKVSRVWVDGHRAVFSRADDKLLVTPQSPLADGATFVTRVQYAGVPRTHIDPDGSSEGWLKTTDGAVALGEPVGAMDWFPNNDTLRDKARYSFTIHAPARLQVAANGHLVRRTTRKRTSTWHYVMAQPMASYLATIAVGRFRLHRSRTRDGIRLLSFTDPTTRSPARALKQLPRVLGWLQQTFGNYPFKDAGITVDRVSSGYALETQTRPTFPDSVPTTDLVHELAHQWFGDAVTPTDWGDIWLNEGFATYAEWLWSAHVGSETPAQKLQDRLAELPAGDSFWTLPPEDLGDPANLFASAVYERGAMTLQALRETVGSAHFFTILHDWYTVHRGHNASSAQFEGLAELVSGRDLSTFFDQWLRAPHRPDGW